MNYSTEYECGLCGFLFPSRAHLHLHKARTHTIVYGGGQLQDSPFAQGENPFQEFPDENRMNELYRDSSVYILQPHDTSQDSVLIFNYPIRGHVTQTQLASQMRSIYRHANKAYKLELSAGVILRNSETGALRYFKPEANAYVLEQPLPVTDKETMEAGIRYLRSIDIDDLIRSFRPNTKWVVQYITNLEWHAWKTNYPLGAKLNATDLPLHIRVSPCILTEFDYRGFEQCCLFVCLSQFLEPNKRACNHRMSVRGLLHRWLVYCQQRQIKGYEQADPAKFPGVEWKDLPHFEDCYQLNVCILELKADNSSENRLTSGSKYKQTMYLNVWENHLSLITAIHQYSRKYTCNYCMRMFKTYWLLTRHQKTCSKQSSLVFPKGAFKYHKTVFQQLEEVGIHVPEADRYFSYVICFDLEAILQPHHQISDSGKTTFHNIHKPISCSICSNVENYTDPLCIIDQDPDTLVQKMFAYFHEIRDAIRVLTNAKWGIYLKQLKDKLDARQKKLHANYVAKNPVQPLNERAHQPEAVAEAADNLVKTMRKVYMSDPLVNQYVRLYRMFYVYVNRVNIMSFNGQKYDIPLLSSSLIKYLLRQEKITECEAQSGLSEHDDLVYESEEEFVAMYGGDVDELDNELDQDDMSIARYLDEAKLRQPGKINVIKRSNAYVSISNNFFAFLDVCNFLPANSSYQQFVRAYAEEGEKLHFPYEYLTDVSKLEHPLPCYPGPAWTSQLRGGVDLLDEAYQEYLRDPDGKERPQTGAEVYADIVKNWQDKGYTCLRDLLVAYNNADSLPFVNGLVRMQREYFDQGLDLWKISLGCPGLARVLLMRHAQTKNVLFPLIHPEDEDLFWLYKAATTGGPSIIFTRRAVVGQSYLDPDTERVPCNSVQGYDCSAMYTCTLRNPFPSHMYVRRFEDTGFEPRYRLHYFKMYVWLNFMSKELNLHVRTKLNCGADIRAGRFLLDGLAYSPQGELLAMEYLGCFIHNHGEGRCKLARNSPNPDGYKQWLEKKAYLEEHGYRVLFIWECQMDDLLKENPELREQVRDMKPEFLRKHRKGVSMETILDAVRDETFYGFLVVDITTPSHLRELMDTFPPIFSNTNVNMSDLGSVMRDYANDRGIKIENRRLLLSGLEAKEIMLSSRLLAFYLSLGLEVTRIYQTISFVKSYPFATFVDEVTKHRKAAQRDPNRKMVGEIYKLLGNAAFGSQLLDKSKYTKTSYVEGSTACRRMVNEPQFRSMKTIGDQIFEVRSAHRRISIDVVLTNGLTILFEAKLMLLRWHYSFLSYFIPRDRFLHVLTDTDSLYTMYNGASLADTVADDKKEEFNHLLKGYCGKALPSRAMLPRTCCERDNFDDQKEPGLWKLEIDAKIVIALTSKTYVCQAVDGKLKLSCKGVNSKVVRRNSPLEMYSKVLETRNPEGSENRGFRSVNGSTYTYSVYRNAFPWLYLKRDLLTGGIYTRTLPITLVPSPKNHLCLQQDLKPLGPDYELEFAYTGYKVQTIRQAHCLMKFVYCSQHNTIQTNHIVLNNKILNTTCQKRLHQLLNSMGDCEAWSRDEYDVLYYIVLQRMSTHPSLNIHLDSNDVRYIVNACRLNAVMGNGETVLVTRYKKGAFLQGGNFLGKIYMTLRTQLSQLLNS